MSRSKITSASIEDSTIAAADIASGAVESAISAPLSHRNLIINGAMQVAQRATSSTGQTGSGYHTCDRLRFDISGLGTWTVEQSTDAPSGFNNSLKGTCTTADASPAAADYLLYRYYIEAQDMQQLAYGTSDAKDMTLSFWIKSNKTGIGTVEFQALDNSNTRHNQNYTISSADTWEYKTMVIPGDTSGNIDNDSGAGMQIIFWITTGSDWTTGTLSDSGWAGSMPGVDRNAGGTLTIGTAVNDYIAMTGLQLEIGSVATPFEHRSYGEELQRCQRYYQIFKHRIEDDAGSSGKVYFCGYSFPVTMRAGPSQTTTYNDSNNVDTGQVHFRNHGGAYGFSQGLRESASGSCWANITNTFDAEF